MGEQQVFQPLTREDKFSVVLYRGGIVLSAIIVAGLAFFLSGTATSSTTPVQSLAADGLLYGLFAAVGMSVFFIHLYVGRFKRYLRNLYVIGLGCLAALLVIGKGSLSGALAQQPATALLLLPLSGCLGFVTAKEAFCFRLFEGYLLAMLMPVYLLLVAGTGLNSQGAGSGLVLIAALLVLFTLRKVFMPIAYDIGDKSAYQ